MFDHPLIQQNEWLEKWKPLYIKISQICGPKLVPCMAEPYPPVRILVKSYSYCALVLTRMCQARQREESWSLLHAVCSSDWLRWTQFGCATDLLLIHLCLCVRYVVIQNGENCVSTKKIVVQPMTLPIPAVMDNRIIPVLQPLLHLLIPLASLWLERTLCGKEKKCWMKPILQSIKHNKTSIMFMIYAVIIIMFISSDSIYSKTRWKIIWFTKLVTVHDVLVWCGFLQGD